MEKGSDWSPIATAPADADLELSIYDEGEYHALPADAKAQAGAMWAQTVLCHWSRRIGGHGDTIALK